MRKRNNSGRGGSRRPGGDDGPDLFAKQLSEVVQQAFAATAGEAGVVEAKVPAEAPLESPPEDRIGPRPVESTDTLPALGGPAENVVAPIEDSEATGLSP